MSTSTAQKPRKKFVLRIPLRRRKRNLKPASTTTTTTTTQTKDNVLADNNNKSDETAIATTPIKTPSVASPTSPLTPLSDAQTKSPNVTPATAPAEPVVDDDEKCKPRSLTLRQHIEDDDLFTDGDDDEETDARKRKHPKKCDRDDTHDSETSDSDDDSDRKETEHEIDALRVVDREYEMLMQDTMASSMCMMQNHHNNKHTTTTTTTTTDEEDWVQSEKQTLAAKYASTREASRHSMTRFIEHALEHTQLSFIVDTAAAATATASPSMQMLQNVQLSQLFNDADAEMMTALVRDELDAFLADQHLEVDRDLKTVAFAVDAYEQQCNAVAKAFESCPLLYVLLSQKYIDMAQVCTFEMAPLCVRCVNAVIRKKVQRRLESLVKKANARRVEDALFAQWLKSRAGFVGNHNTTNNNNSKQEMDIDDADDLPKIDAEHESQTDKNENEIETNNSNAQISANDENNDTCDSKEEQKIATAASGNEENKTVGVSNETAAASGPDEEETKTASNDTAVPAPEAAALDSEKKQQQEDKEEEEEATANGSTSLIVHEEYPLFSKPYVRFLQSFPQYRNGIVSGQVAIEKIFALDQHQLLQPPSLLSPATAAAATEAIETAEHKSNHSHDHQHRKRKHVEIIDITTTTASSSPKKRKVVIDVEAADHSKERVVWHGTLISSDSVQCHVGLKQIGGKSIWFLPFKRKKSRNSHAHSNNGQPQQLTITGRISLSSIVKFIKQLRKHKSRRILFAEIESTEYTHPNAYNTFATQLRKGGKAGVIDFEKDGILIYVLSSEFLSPSHSASRELLKYFDGHRAKLPKTPIFAIMIITHSVYSRVKRKVSKTVASSSSKPRKPGQPPLPGGDNPHMTTRQTSSNSDTDSTNMTMPTAAAQTGDSTAADHDAVWDQIHHEIDEEHHAIERESLGELPPPLPPHLLAEREQFRTQQQLSTSPHHQHHHHVHPQVHVGVPPVPPMAVPVDVPVSMYYSGPPQSPMPHFGYAPPRPFPPTYPVPHESGYVIRPHIIMHGMNAPHHMHAPHFGYPPRPPQPPLPR